MLSRGTGFRRAAMSFEVGEGQHGSYPGADGIFFDNEAEVIKCVRNDSSVPVQILSKPFDQKRLDIAALGRWVSESRQSNSCGLIMVLEFFPASYEPVWRELQQLYHPLSTTGRALRTQLLYSPDKFNIAIHARIGDIIPTQLSYFSLCLHSVLTAIQTFSVRGAVDVWLFSEVSNPGLEADLLMAVQSSPFLPAGLRLEARSASPLLTFVYLTEADVLIASDSSFSWMATFMSTKPVVIVAPETRNENRRTYLGERQQHILANVDGELITNTTALTQAAHTFFTTGQH